MKIFSLPLATKYLNTKIGAVEKFFNDNWLRKASKDWRIKVFAYKWRKAYFTDISLDEYLSSIVWDNVNQTEGEAEDEVTGEHVPETESERVIWF